MRRGPGWPADVAAASRRRILAAEPSFPLGLLSGAQRCCARVPAGHRRSPAHCESSGGGSADGLRGVKGGWVGAWGEGGSSAGGRGGQIFLLQSDMQSLLLVQSDLTSEINFCSASTGSNPAVIGSDSASRRPNQPAPRAEPRSATDNLYKERENNFQTLSPPPTQLHILSATNNIRPLFFFSPDLTSRLLLFSLPSIWLAPRQNSWRLRLQLLSTQLSCLTVAPIIPLGVR